MTRQQRGVLLSVTLVLAGLTAVKSAAVDCVKSFGLPNEQVEFLFDGTVVEETKLPTAVRSVVQVHRVWKGEVPARFVVYGLGQIDGIPALHHGKRYLVSASRGWDTPDIPAEAATLLVCGAIEFSPYLQREVGRHLGRGRPPRALR